MVGYGMLPSAKKWPMSPPTKFFIPLHKSLSSPCCYLKWPIKVQKLKKLIKLKKQNESIFPGNLKKFSACGAHIYKNWPFMTMNVCCTQETSSFPSPLKFWISLHNSVMSLPPYSPDPNEKLWNRINTQVCLIIAIWINRIK